jgi:hypothetical protein
MIHGRPCLGKASIKSSTSLLFEVSEILKKYMRNSEGTDHYEIASTLALPRSTKGFLETRHKLKNLHFELWSVALSAAAEWRRGESTETLCWRRDLPRY